MKFPEYDKGIIFFRRMSLFWGNSCWSIWGKQKVSIQDPTSLIGSWSAKIKEVFIGIIRKFESELNIR